VQAGPVQAPAQKYVERYTTKKAEEAEEDDASMSEEESPGSEDEVMDDAPEESSESEAAEAKKSAIHSRKRKRGDAGDDLEASYMRRIEKEERKAEEKRKVERAEREKPAEKDDASEGSDDKETEDSDEEDKNAAPPVHESVSGGAKSAEVEKSSRTVFLGNVSTEAIKSKAGKKTLLRHLASFCSNLPESTGPHKVESIRFRSTAFASGGGVPKRASFAKRDVLDETTPSTNAYAVYTTAQAARKAPIALNGTVVLDRHLRVDSIAHPAAVDNKRCVFVGNLDFIDQEGATDESGKKKKVRAPADIEEGLWRVFNEHTGGKSNDKNVESVRVIRDGITRVGKGFAYVQFYDGNAVEEALLLNEKKFPPLLPRKLRVTRARKVMKKRDDGNKDSRKGDLAQKTLQGRASKLLGRAGAAKIKEASKGGIAGNSFVFEGHRATEGSSSIKVKTKSRGSKGKPKGRSSRRAAAYRAAGGQKSWTWKKS